MNLNSNAFITLKSFSKIALIHRRDTGNWVSLWSHRALASGVEATLPVYLHWSEKLGGMRPGGSVEWVVEEAAPGLGQGQTQSEWEREESPMRFMLKDIETTVKCISIFYVTSLMLLWIQLFRWRTLVAEMNAPWYLLSQRHYSGKGEKNVACSATSGGSFFGLWVQGVSSQALYTFQDFSRRELMFPSLL